MAAPSLESEEEGQSPNFPKSTDYKTSRNKETGLSKRKQPGKRLRVKLGWRDCISGDANISGIRNWWAAARDRENWSKLLEAARTQ